MRKWLLHEEIGELLHLEGPPPFVILRAKLINHSTHFHAGVNHPEHKE